VRTILSFGCLWARETHLLRFICIPFPWTFSPFVLDGLNDRDEQQAVDERPRQAEEAGEGEQAQGGEGGEEEPAVEEQCVLSLFFFSRPPHAFAYRPFHPFRAFCAFRAFCFCFVETPKDPGIPSEFPYKDQILAEVAEQRRIVRLGSFLSVIRWIPGS
jgi:hypothetical protein